MLVADNCHTEVDDHFICKMCFDVVNEPVECKICCHLSCAQCYANWIRASYWKTCAFCRQSGGNKPHVNRFVMGTLKAYKFDCDMCSTVIDYATRKEHWQHCKIDLHSAFENDLFVASDEDELRRYYALECLQIQAECIECGYQGTREQCMDHICGDLQWLTFFDEY